EGAVGCNDGGGTGGQGRGGAGPCGGAAPGHLGAVRRAEPGGVQGSAARPGSHPHGRRPAAAAERGPRLCPAGSGRDRRRVVTRRVSILLLAAGGWTLFVWVTRLSTIARH